MSVFFIEIVFWLDFLYNGEVVRKGRSIRSF